MDGVRTHEIVKNISHISRNILLSKLMKRIITILNRNHKLKITLLFDSIHRLKCVFYVWNLVKFSCGNQYYLKWKHYLLYTVINSGSQINVVNLVANSIRKHSNIAALFFFHNIF